MMGVEKNSYIQNIKSTKLGDISANICEKGPFYLTENLIYKQSSIGVDVHAADEVCAILILEPVRNLRLCSGGGDEFVINCVAGTVCVMPADQAVVITWPQPVSFINIKFGGFHDLIKKNVNNRDSLSIFSSKRCLQVGKIISDQVNDEDKIDSDFIKSLYIVITNLIFRSYFLSREVSVNNSGLSAYACRQIEGHLKENFRNSISVLDMADYLGMSSGHFASCFRESFGETPHQYLMNLRLDDAERCLKETDIPISEIAIGLNFSSQSHLTTALKKYRQLTPGEVRRRSSFNRRRS